MNEKRNKKWKVVELKEVADILPGQSPESKFYNKDHNGLPFYQGKKEFTDMLIGEPRVWTSKSTKIAEKDDILMSIRAPVGPVNIATQKACIGRGIASIRPKKINNLFLFYFLRESEHRIKGSDGAVFNSINKHQIEKIKVPCPPLKVQKEMVKKIERFEEEMDKVETRKSNEREKVFELRKNAIKRLIEGDQIKKAEIVKLGDVCNIKRGKSITKKQTKNGKIPVVAGGKVPPYYHKEANRKAPVITVSGSGAYAGFVNFFKEPIFASDCSTIQPKNDCINIKFIFHLLKSKQEKIYDMQQGGAQPHVYLKDLQTIDIPSPPLKIQKEIVAKIEKAEKELDLLDEKIDEGLQHTKNLRKSVINSILST